MGGDLGRPRSTGECHLTEWCSIGQSENTEDEVFVLDRCPIEWPCFEGLLAWIESAKEHAARVVTLRLEAVRQTLMVSNSIGFGWLQGFRKLRQQECLSLHSFHAPFGAHCIARSCVMRNRVGDRNWKTLYRCSVGEHLIPFFIPCPG